MGKTWKELYENVEGLGCITKDELVEIFERVLNKELIPIGIVTRRWKTFLDKEFTLEDDERNFSFVLTLSVSDFFGEEKKIAAFIGKHSVYPRRDSGIQNAVAFEITFPNASWDKLTLTEQQDALYYQRAKEFFYNTEVGK